MTKLDYSTKVQSIGGEAKDLSQYQGRVMLIVNTASKCGYTPQLKGLEELHRSYKEQGLSVLGFPCNQFLKQEPGAEAEIAEFCQINYGVTFDLHSKIKVNGEGTHPLYEQLKAAKSGLLGTRAIKWNFTKFLVGKEGRIVGRYGPKVTPAELAPVIEKALAGGVVR